MFGNGMLLSRTLQLRAAFDHRHIFLDPAPNAEASWLERKRLFDLPTSSWDDYSRKIISPGGGVWARSLKSIPLSPEVQALLDVKAQSLAPEELISALLKSRTDLFYLGGIGTYVKASSESDADVGDKANDGVRINGGELRCRVVGEGANLGFTQAGRVEFALKGGRIDTDAIDNSGGVDTSDHEVNIKILTGVAIRTGDLEEADRDPLLASMTEEISRHVLSNNYDQTLVLSLLESDASRDLESHAAFMTLLERRGRLDRALEGLPNESMIAERRKTGQGLTRPELAVLVAYGKIELCDDIVASPAPDDPALLATLRRYFPSPLAKFQIERERHPLRREIIATVLGNELVNLCGPTFPDRLRAAANCDTRSLIAAFVAARHILHFSESWSAVARLDGKISAAAQTALFKELVYLLRGEIYWLARRASKASLGMQALSADYGPAADALRSLALEVLSPFERRAAVRRANQWIKLGAPKPLAHSIALMRPLTAASTLTELAASQSWPIENAAFVYHRVGGQLGFDKLRAAAGAAASDSRDAYERLATRRLIEDMLSEQAAIAGAVMSHAGRPRSLDHPERDVSAVGAWSAVHAEPVRTAKASIEEIDKAGGGWTFAKLTVANTILRELSAF